MTLITFKRILATTMASAVLTASAYFGDVLRTEIVQTRESLKIARQITAQAEGLMFIARQVGDSSPLTWAAHQLSQGVDPRALRVSKIQIPVDAAGESYEFDRREGALTYRRILRPEDGQGVLVSVITGYTGFLGSRSSFTNDLWALFFFAAFWFVMYREWTRRVPAPVETITVTRDTAEVKRDLASWNRRFKDLLTQLGGHIREMVREAQNVAVAAGKSRASMSDLRDRIHGGLKEIHDARQASRTADAVAAEIEKLARKMDSQELLEQVQKLRKLTQKSAATVAALEVSLEPWATDADVAYHAYDDVFAATQKMDLHIRKTTETLLKQAKLVQELNQDLVPAPLAAVDSSRLAM